MSTTEYYLLALFLAGVMLWQLISGKALGAWWHPVITRQGNPRTYWLVLAAQCAILIAFLLTGKAWHIR
jgi:hypothetical protein